MRLYTPLISGLALFALVACQSEEDLAREVLAEALQSYAMLKDDSLPTKERLAAAQAVSEALQRIVQDYGTTDLGLELAAGGTVGEMSADGLRLRILELQQLRAMELCTEQPTATCVIDRLVQAEGLENRQELLQEVDVTTEVFMALATGETDIVTDWYRSYTGEQMGSAALGLAPADRLTDQLIETARDRMREDLLDVTSLIAAWRALTGEDSAALRALAQTGDSGAAILTFFDSEQDAATLMTQLDAGVDDKVDWDNMRQAEALLGAFEGAAPESYPFAIMEARFGLAETVAAFPAEWDVEPEYMRETFGPEAAKLRIEDIFADPESDPRALSLALMEAPLLLPVETLREEVAALKDAEVQTWDNLRILPTFVALGHIGDRALFEATRQLLAPVEIHDYLEEMWSTGQQLAEGTLSDTALQDDRVFRAAARVGATLGSKETLSAFMRDGVTKIDDATAPYSTTLGRTDIALYARACGLTQVLRALEVTEEDLDGYPNRCDRARLGTLPAQLPEEDFAFYLDNADLFVADTLEIVRHSIGTTPERAYAFVQALQDEDDRMDATGFLAFALARAEARSGTN